MGTMEKMRKTSPYFLAAFAILFVGFMVASDADISNLMRQGSNYQTAEVANVNGDPILYREYEARVKEAVENKQKDTKDKDVQIDENQIRSEVWTQMIDDILLKQEAKKAGIIISDEDILDVMLETPPEFLAKPFTDSLGNFNKALYLEIVTNPDKLVNYIPKNVAPEEKAKIVMDFKKNLISVDKYLRQQKLIDALTAVVNTTTGALSPTFVRNEFINQYSNADLNYIFFDKKSVEDFQLKITDSEIKDYYDSHKDLYKSKPQRKIKYINIAIVPSKEDTIRVNKKVQRLTADLQTVSIPTARDSIFDIASSEYGGTTHDYELISKIDNSKLAFITSMKNGDVIGPIVLNDGTYFFRMDGKRAGDNEAVKASHILIRFGNNKDSAKAEAEKILQRAKSGEDFADLAKKYSEDKSSGMNGGDLGYFEKGKMIKEFEEAAFSAKPGSIVGPVETQYGYHIIKVIAKESEELKYTEIKFVPSTSTQTKNALFRMAYSFERQVEDGSPFDTIAKRMDVRSSVSPFFGKKQPIFGSQYLTDKVFDSKMGEVTPPTDVKNVGIIVTQVTDDRKEGISPLEDVRQAILTKLKDIKRIDIMKAKAQAVYNKIANAGSLQNAKNIDPTLQVESATNVKNDGRIGEKLIDYVFSTKVFMVPLNKITEPIRGTQGYIIMQVINRSVPDEAMIKSQLPGFLMSMKKGMGKDDFNTWFTDIKENANIKDYRLNFYKEY